MIKNIVVPTDGSEHADRAVALATEIALKYEARLIFLQVLLRHTSTATLRDLCKQLDAPDEFLTRLDAAEDSMVYTTAVGYAPVPVIVPTEILHEVGQLIVANAKKAAEAQGVRQVKTLVSDGNPAECITGAVKTENAELVVMGRRGLGNVAGILMGSISHKVSHLVDCACITVK